ncbi:MAG: murein L,D-transpeptidase catalytic domain family protein [Marinicellaceae bacterium]
MKIIIFLYFIASVFNSALAKIDGNDLKMLDSKISENVLNMAINAVNCANQGANKPIQNISIIDYSLPSTTKRFWSFDVINNELLFHEFVAHGKNTGANYAKKFSNIPGSKQSSIGLFKTAGTYNGSNGYSLILNGLEKGFNDMAQKRYIVMHGAAYVSQKFIDKHGRLGRSWGCPAFEKKLAKTIIDQIKQGQFLFIYYPEDEWLKKSEYINCQTP